MSERRPWRRMALVTAVLLAVAVRFLTPVGWMPNPGGAHGSLFVICTADGPHWASGPGLPAPAPDHKAPHEHCLFGGFSLVGGPDLALAPAPPERFVLPTGQPPVRRILWRTRRKHSPQSPRAPPLDI